MKTVFSLDSDLHSLKRGEDVTKSLDMTSRPLMLVIAAPCDGECGSPTDIQRPQIMAKRDKSCHTRLFGHHSGQHREREREKRKAMYVCVLQQDIAELPFVHDGGSGDPARWW